MSNRMLPRLPNRHRQERNGIRHWSCRGCWRCSSLPSDELKTATRIQASQFQSQCCRGAGQCSALPSDGRTSLKHVQFCDAREASKRPKRLLAAKRTAPSADAQERCLRPERVASAVNCHCKRPRRGSRWPERGDVLLCAQRTWRPESDRSRQRRTSARNHMLPCISTQRLGNGIWLDCGLFQPHSCKHSNGPLLQQKLVSCPATGQK